MFNFKHVEFQVPDIVLDDPFPRSLEIQDWEFRNQTQVEVTNLRKK